MWTDMAVATDYRRDLSGLVQAGLRAVSVRATTDGSFTLIRPGDRVDVIATLAQGQDQRQDQRESVVLLQNVLVLAVGLDMGNDPLAKGQPHQDRNDQILTLSVNIPETQLLALASEKGRLTVAVRNPDDIRVAEGLSDMSSTTLTDTKSRTAVQAVRKTGPVRLESGGTVQ
jgi:pilus assembly protein CpaB